MSFHTVSEELRLATDKQTFVRTFSFTREATASAPREEVFVLFELPDRPAAGEQIAEAVFQTLREVCFLNTEIDSYERFETALKEVNAVIAEHREQLPNKNFGRLNAVIGLLSAKDLHLTQTGDAEAYLARRGTLTTVTEGLIAEADETVDIFVNIASGRVENHDKLIVASERLLRYATKNEITKIFSPNKEIGLALEELDEIIVLEGAQTTTIFALDIVTEAAARRAGFTPTNSGGDAFASARKHASRGLSWVKDRLPESAKIPGGREMPIDKNYLILGFLVVLILIILSVSWSLGSSRNSVQLEEVKVALESVQTNIDLAKTRRNIGDKEQAYVLLTDAEATANDLVQAGAAVEEAETMLTEIATIRDELDNIRRYSELTPLVDISTEDAAVSLVGLADFHGRKTPYDAHRLFDTTLDQVTGTSELDATSIVRSGKYFADRDNLVFVTTDGKVVEWRDGEVSYPDTADETWKSAVDLSTYSKYLYLLDPTNNQIWKYQRNSDAYGYASGYNENADLTKAVGIAIDGDVWVLVNDADGDMSNDIIRIRKGEKKALNISDLPTDSWVNPSRIFTNENLKFIYVLDGANSRILRFYKDPPEAGTEDRTLEYNMQYRFEDLTDIRDFWVDDAEQKIYVETAQKIYEVSI